jgi:hypothetical protein
MYGSVLSGGLSGHVHGTAAYDITTTGEPEGMRPHIWDALNYESGKYMQPLRNFILSEGSKYQLLQTATQDIHPQKAPGAPEKGLDGWSYMMRTPEKDYALLYFENQAVLPELAGFKPKTTYGLQWYNTISGAWSEIIHITSDRKGIILLPGFPDGISPAVIDRAAKIIEVH